MKDKKASEPTHELRDILISRLCQLREERGVTVEQLADALNITLRAYRAMEAGTWAIRVSHIEALANFYNTSTDYLFKLTDDPSPRRRKENEPTP